MTKLELFDRIEKIRSSFLTLCEKVGVGGSQHYSGHTEYKYPNIPNVHYDEDEKVTENFPICSHYNVLHSELLATLEEFGIENFKKLSMVYKISIRKLEEVLLNNCSYEYQDEIKNHNINSQVTL